MNLSQCVNLAGKRRFGSSIAAPTIEPRGCFALHNTEVLDRRGG